jgi:hypothetical protein
MSGAISIGGTGQFPKPPIVIGVTKENNDECVSFSGNVVNSVISD